MKTKTQSNQNKSNKSSELQSRPEQLSSENIAAAAVRKDTKLIPVDFDLRRANRSLPTDKVLQLLQEQAPRFFELAEVVGQWVWIQFTEKQPREVTATLAQLGFHWNNKRQAWQHPCGQFMTEPASYDPRKRYGSEFPADAKAA